MNVIKGDRTHYVDCSLLLDSQKWSVGFRHMKQSAAAMHALSGTHFDSS